MKKPELWNHFPAIQKYVMLYLSKKKSFLCGVTPNAGLAAAENSTRDSTILWTHKMPHQRQPTAAPPLTLRVSSPSTFCTITTCYDHYRCRLFYSRTTHASLSLSLDLHVCSPSSFTPSPSCFNFNFILSTSPSSCPLPLFHCPY